MVERFDPFDRPGADVVDRHLRVHQVVADQPRVIDLHQKAGIDDGPVFDVHGVGDGEQILVVGLVIFVFVPILDVGRRDARHEHLGDIEALQRGLEIVELGLERGLALVGQRRRAGHLHLPGARRGAFLGLVVVREAHRLARRQPRVRAHAVGLQAAETVAIDLAR